MSGTRAIPSARTTGVWERSNPDGQRAPRPESEADGLTILLADDEAPIRGFVGLVLRSCGYTVLEAGDGVEALEVAERHPGPIHLLLTDWCMPRLDGGELISRLSNQRPEAAILIMTGYMDVELPPTAPVLRKPFKPQALVESISGALHRSDCHGMPSP